MVLHIDGELMVAASWIGVVDDVHYRLFQCHVDFVGQVVGNLEIVGDGSHEALQDANLSRLVLEVDVVGEIHRVGIDGFFQCRCFFPCAFSFLHLCLNGWNHDFCCACFFLHLFSHRSTFCYLWRFLERSYFVLLEETDSQQGEVVGRTCHGSMTFRCLDDFFDDFLRIGVDVVFHHFHESLLAELLLFVVLHLGHAVGVEQEDVVVVQL